MNVDILIVSCARHFPWLRYSLRSIARFATGFREVKVLIPSDDLTGIGSLLAEFTDHPGIPIRVAMFEDWPDKGFLRHEHVIMCSDEYTDADFVCHVDSDCLFTEPVTPADYFVGEKPVLLHASFHWLITTQQANLEMWKHAAERALGFEVTEECMRRHPAVHYRKVYPATRYIIEKHTGKPFADFVRSGVNAFPQDIAEFPTLGAVAWTCFHDEYHWINQETDPWPHNKLTQFWSVSPPEIPQKPIFRGQPFECTPESLLQIV